MKKTSSRSHEKDQEELTCLKTNGGPFTTPHYLGFAQSTKKKTALTSSASSLDPRKNKLTHSVFKQLHEQTIFTKNPQTKALAMSADTLIKFMYLKNGMAEQGEKFEDLFAAWRETLEAANEKEGVPAEWVDK